MIDSKWLRRPRYTPQRLLANGYFRPNSHVVHIFNAWIDARGDGIPRQGDIKQLKKGMEMFSDDTWKHLAQLLGWSQHQVMALGGKTATAHPLLEAKGSHQPIQPLIIDHQGVPRFKKNVAVDFLLEKGGPLTMNDLAMKPGSKGDREQFAQLIGYSHSGFGNLSYASDRVYNLSREELDGRDAALIQARLREEAVHSRDQMREQTQSPETVATRRPISRL